MTACEVTLFSFDLDDLGQGLRGVESDSPVG